MKLTGIIETIFEGRYVFRGFATLEELALFSKPNYNYQRVPDEKRIDTPREKWYIVCHQYPVCAQVCTRGKKKERFV